MQRLSLGSEGNWKQLLRHEGEACVSIYMPTGTADAAQTAGTRFANHVRSAARRLLEFEVDVSGAEEILSPVQELPHRGLDLVSGRGSDGTGGAVGIFARRGDVYVADFPGDAPEEVFVDRRFRILPLLPAAEAAAERLHILALEPPGVRVIRASRLSAEKIDVPDLPHSIEELPQRSEDERHLQFHTGTPQSQRGQRRAAIYHGHGGGGVDDSLQKKDLLQFFQQLDNVLAPWLHAHGQDPLVLAGTEYLLPLYRQANHYAHLLDAELSTDPRRRTPHELRDAVWPHVEAEIELQRRADLDRLRRHVGTRAASTLLTEIAAAATAHRIEALFVAPDARRWAPRLTPNEPPREVRLHRQAGHEELLNWAAVRVLNGGGRVHLQDAETLPQDAVAAALFRYAE
ncbi:MAG: hypothetical protein GF330_14915 [Candidatus Eisenbacteria bacterium]|nr:hypothetical protein [Candidatus Eisenbacteria bacterium]